MRGLEHTLPESHDTDVNLQRKMDQWFPLWNDNMNSSFYWIIFFSANAEGYSLPHTTLFSELTFFPNEGRMRLILKIKSNLQLTSSFSILHSPWKFSIQISFWHQTHPSNRISINLLRFLEFHLKFEHTLSRSLILTLASLAAGECFSRLYELSGRETVCGLTVPWVLVFLRQSSIRR